MDKIRESVLSVIGQVNGAILGKEEAVRQVMIAFLAGGHVLLTDLPGTGKTTMAMAFAAAMDLEYRRVQMTPDVMPSDLTGFSVFRKEQEDFVFRKGSVFCNLLLADELNRTSPKTQSALLEVMEEGKTTGEGVTRQLPQPFLVIATQNPGGSAGTQPLPQSQVDRFMVSLSIGYPDFEHEVAMARQFSAKKAVEQVKCVIDRDTFIAAQKSAEQIYLNEEMFRYVTSLVRASRNHPMIRDGASPRATLSLVKSARAAAWLDGREYAAPRDVESQFLYVMEHRIRLYGQAEMEGEKPAGVLTEILRETEKPYKGA